MTEFQTINATSPDFQVGFSNSPQKSGSSNTIWWVLGFAGFLLLAYRIGVAVESKRNCKLILKKEE